MKRTEAPEPEALTETPVQLGQAAVWIEREVSPKRAAELLQRLHPGQRSLRERHVERIAKAMSDGNFKWLGDPLRFDPSGQVIDGQHRLAACVASGVPMRDVLCLRLDDAQAIQYIDTAVAPRSVRDIQRVRGGGAYSGALIAAVALEFSDFSQTQLSHLSKVDKVELVDSCEHIEQLSELYGIGNYKLGVTSGSLAGVLRCLRANSSEAARFFTAAFNNTGIVSGVPCSQARLLADYLLSNRRMRSTRSRGALRGDPVADAAKSISAYNAWRMGKEMSKLQYSGGAVPKARV